MVQSSAAVKPLESTLAEGAALLDSGDVAAALAVLESAEPHYHGEPALSYAFGVAHYALGDRGRSHAAFEQCLAAEPSHPEAAYHLGLLARADGAEETAVGHFRAALAVRPAFAQAAFELTTMLRSLERAEEAFEVCTKALGALLQRGQTDDALALAREAMLLAPDASEPAALCGRLLLMQGHYDAAAACLERAVKLDPDNAACFNELGLAMFKRGDGDAAAKRYQQALARRTIFPEARNNLGNVHARAGQPTRAIEQYRFAVAQAPGYAEAWYNLSRELPLVDDLAGALAAADTAIEKEPAFAPAHVQRASLLLRAGRYRDGWRAYEWRVPMNTGEAYLRRPDDPALTLPRPSSLDLVRLRGARVLVLPEPTLGDELFFLRFVDALHAHGIEPRYAPSAKLRPLLEATSRLEGVLPPDALLTGFGAVLASGDLPQVLGHDGQTFPAPLALSVPAALQAPARQRLRAAGPAPYLGVTWRAGEPDDGVMRKFVPVARLARSLGGWPGTLVALQRDADAGELAELRGLSGRPVADGRAEAGDLLQSAALLSVVDDYVGVSNTNMHLRGSLGLPVRVLVKHPGEWRWAEKGTTTPWYPGAELYRETRREGWQPALDALAAALDAH